MLALHHGRRYHAMMVISHNLISSLLALYCPRRNGAIKNRASLEADQGRQ